jgi:hypothetical protein
MAVGGYREGSGRSKFGYYKGIFCGSTYELCWVIYNIDHNIAFKRFEGYLSDGTIKYYPDFLIDEKSIVEIKGYHTPQVDLKTELAIKNGYSISILYKDDLEYAFSYVKNKYSIKSKENFHTLYDEYKPTFNLICGFCGISYQTDKADKMFCSRECSGKYRFKENISNVKIRKKMSKPPVQRKLTDEQVKEIYNSKENNLDIAKKFNINKSNVYFIKAKKIHKEILKDL